MLRSLLQKRFLIGLPLLTLLASCATPETPTSEPTATAAPTEVPTAVSTNTPVPITMTWTKMTDMPSPRFGHSASVVDGMIYVIGGVDSMTKVEMYDPATDSWTQKTDMLTGRMWFSTAVVDGKIYAIGGEVEDSYEPLATVEMYDPVTDTWTTKANLPVPRFDLATVVLDGKIYAIGGGTGSEGATKIVEVYDPMTDSWTSGTNMLSGMGASAVVIEGKIYVIDPGGVLLLRFLIRPEICGQGRPECLPPLKHTDYQSSNMRVAFMRLVDG